MKRTPLRPFYTIFKEHYYASCIIFLSFFVFFTPLRYVYERVCLEYGIEEDDDDDHVFVISVCGTLYVSLTRQVSHHGVKWKRLNYVFLLCVGECDFLMFLLSKMTYMIFSCIFDWFKCSWNESSIWPLAETRRLH